jgi:hypothetical protein
MRLWEIKQPKYSGSSESYTIGLDFLSGGSESGIQINGAPCICLPLDQARQLARKILSIPTPVGFKELPDA